MYCVVKEGLDVYSSTLTSHHKHFYLSVHLEKNKATN